MCIIQNYFCFSRLESYERNSNFGIDPDRELQPEFKMTVPAVSAYTDLNSDKKFVQFSITKLEAYLSPFDKELDDNAVDLYKAKRLLYVRIAFNIDHTYIKAACKSQFTKSNTYYEDISFSNDGHVQEAQCDCGAGMGPYAHCKHVQAVLFGLTDFVNTGCVKLQETCTQKLQTFHQAKKFTGSPLKANMMNLPSADELTNGDFDPRPSKYRKTENYDYESYFRSTCLNFRGVHKMPIFQLFEPANAKAAAHDHDYLELTPEDNFLQAIGLLNLTDEKRDNIERYTRGQSKNRAWTEERLKRIQSSNFGKICKATEKTDLGKLAVDSITEKKDLKVDAIVHGKKYEADALTRYKSDFNVDISECGIFVSKEYPFLGASPDGITEDNIILEVKCPFRCKNKTITSKDVPYLKPVNDNNFILNPGHNYYYQIQGQLFCADKECCDLIIYTITDVKYIRIRRDDEFIATMIGKLKSFYEKYLKPAILDKMFYKEYCC